MSSTASLAKLRWYPASNLCMAASCSSVIVFLLTSGRSSRKSAMTPLAHSLVDQPAEQNFDNRKRQYDVYDHDHDAARRDHRLGFAHGTDDLLRQRVLRDIDPPLDPWCCRYQIGLAFIRDHRVRRSAQIGRWHGDQGGLCRLGLGMVYALRNTRAMYRCCVPAMIDAMPIEMYRSEMLTRFGLAH